MIIGKGGSYIKEIKEKTGAYAQVSMKSADPRLVERVVTVIGAPEQLLSATELILAKMATDPTANQFNNTSYADISASLNVDGNMDATVTVQNGTNTSQNGQVKMDERNNNTILANNKSSNQPTPGFPNNFYSSQVFQPASGIGVMGNSHVFSADPNLLRNSTGGGYSPRLNGPQFITTGQMGDLGGAQPIPITNGISNAGLLQFLENLQMSLRSAGYNDLALTEIMGAMQTLAKYNVLGLAFGFGVTPLTPQGVMTTHQTFPGSLGGFMPGNANLIAGGFKFGQPGHKVKTNALSTASIILFMVYCFQQNGLAPEFIPSANQMSLMSQPGEKGFQQGWKQPDYIDYPSDYHSAVDFSEYSIFILETWFRHESVERQRHGCGCCA